MPIIIETTTEKLTTHSYFRCKFYSCSIRPNHKLQPKSKTYAPEHLTQNIQPNTTENVSLCDKISFQIFCIRQVWTFMLRSTFPSILFTDNRPGTKSSKNRNTNASRKYSELQQFHSPTSGLISCSSGYFKDNARITVEQNNNIVLGNLRSKLEDHLFDENDLASDYRYQHYLQNITRIENKQKVPSRNYNTDTGTISHYQILLPIKLIEELLQALHGQIQTIQDSRR